MPEQEKKTAEEKDYEERLDAIADILAGLGVQPEDLDGD